MWQNPQETADLAIFTEEVLNGKLFFFAQKYILLASKYAKKSKIQNVLLFIISIIFYGGKGWGWKV